MLSCRDLCLGELAELRKAITVFTRVIHALFLNQNFVSKFRVRDLCEETILRRFIMKLKCDNVEISSSGL